MYAHCSTSKMAVRLTILFLLVIAVAVFLQVVFYSSSQISCESDVISGTYAECYCISNPQKLRSFNDIDSLRFYGWVQFFVLLQAIILYIPYRVGTQLDDAERQEKLTLPSRYILEIPVIMALIGVIWMSDKILGGNFIPLGVQVMTHPFTYHSSPSPPPMAEIFPMMAKCQVESYNSNATYSATCFLPMNELNSYAFLFLWIIYSASLACSLCNLTIVVAKIIKNALTRCKSKKNEFTEELLENQEVPASDDLPREKYSRSLNLIIKPIRNDKTFQAV